MDRLGRRDLLDGDDDDDGSDKHTYGWFVIPILGVIALACLIMLLRYRRKKLVRTLNGYRNNALRQDIETMGPPPRQYRTWNLTANRTNNNNNMQNLRGGGGAASHRRQHEGLNELGEAPPAYTARQKQQPDVDEYELSRIGSSQLNLAPPPAASLTPTTTTTTAPPEQQQGSPPSYVEAQQGSVVAGSRHGPEGPARPPPAVLGS